jgi:hypothetical protein
VEQQLIQLQLEQEELENHLMLVKEEMELHQYFQQLQQQEEVVVEHLIVVHQLLKVDQVDLEVEVEQQDL